MNQHKMIQKKEQNIT